MPIEQTTEQALQRAVAEFRLDRSQQLRSRVRRNRATFIRDRMAAVDLDVDTFNKEVWTFESETLLNGRSVKGSIPTVNPIPATLIDELEAALDAGTLELHGNYTWGSATRVYAASATDKSVLKGNLALASQILVSEIAPIEKARRLEQEVHGFGDNIATGLVMMFHSSPPMGQPVVLSECSHAHNRPIFPVLEPPQISLWDSQSAGNPNNG